MRLIQFETAQGQRHVGVIEGDEIHVVLGTETTRELALEAIRKGHGLVAEVLAEAGLGIPLIRLGIGDGEYAAAGAREPTRALHNIDAAGIVAAATRLR